MKPVVVFLLPALLAGTAFAAKKPKDVIVADDCSGKRGALDRLEQRLAAVVSDAAGVDEEIASLEARLTFLKERKAGLGRASERGTKKVAMRKDEYKQACEKTQDCKQYEDAVQALEDRQKPQEALLDSLKKEFVDTRKTTAAIRAQLEPLVKEYQDTKCDDLVPGQTSSATIRRCQDIFLKWNDLQVAINANNNRLPELRGRYKTVSVALDANEKTGHEYEAYLDANCKQSKKLVAVRKSFGVKERAMALQAELDGLLQDLTSVRSIQISVE